MRRGKRRGERRRDRSVGVFLCIWILSFFLLAESAWGETWDAGEVAWFVAGGLSAFVLHESGHALVAESLGFRSRIESRSDPIPFLVVRYDLIGARNPSGEITYVDRNGNLISNGAQKRFVIASAGINMQNITSELILTRYPHLQAEQRPFLKGLLAFNIVTSMGYALVGRKDRDGDIHGMSEALGVRDEWVGVMVFVPAALDLYRYYYPESLWAPWASRGAKGYFLGLSFRW
jgi:hypothetical protein